MPLVTRASYHRAVACGRQALLNAQYNYGQGRLVCRLRAALTAAVFDKARLNQLPEAAHVLCNQTSCQLLHASSSLVLYHVNVKK